MQVSVLLTKPWKGIVLAGAEKEGSDTVIV